MKPLRLRPKERPSFRPSPAFWIMKLRSAPSSRPSARQSSHIRYVASGAKVLIFGMRSLQYPATKSKFSER